MTFVPWSVAMADANSAFYAAKSPLEHFRTSMVAVPEMARALLTLIRYADDELRHPPALDVIEIGAADGGLLDGLVREAHLIAPDLARRLRPHGFDLRARPDALPPSIAWTQGTAPHTLPQEIRGVVIAHEWLDDLPVEVFHQGSGGRWDLVEVDRATGEERVVLIAQDDPGPQWVNRWRTPRHAPLDDAVRIESGHLRDAAWAAVGARIDSGLLIAIDYGSFGTSPMSSPDTTLVGFLDGHPSAPIPDGSMNITAHVAFDTVADAAEGAASARGRAASTGIVSQREALPALWPPDGSVSVSTDRWATLAAASRQAELTAVDGLGAHQWLVQSIGIALPAPWG